jgi:hypothetical protein
MIRELNNILPIALLLKLFLNQYQHFIAVHSYLNHT